MEKSDHKELAARLICIGFAIAAVYLLFEYGLYIILPFIAAFCIGVPINKLSKKANETYRIPKKLFAVFMLLVVLLAVGVLLYYGLGRLLSEVEELVSLAENDGGVIENAVDSVINGIGSFAKRLPILNKLGGLEGMRGKIDDGISGLFSALISRLTSSIPTFAIELVKRTPRAVLTLVVTVLGCFYFATDFEGIKKAILSLMSARTERAAKRGWHIVGNALKSYAKAYLLLMLITFVEVFVGLILLKRRYAFIIAIGIAVVDILPLFGTGAVLVPWAIASFFMGNNGVGTGLLVLYGVVTIVRQVIEPRIVGTNLGIHPFATLFAMFLGLSLFGFFGMILGPFAFLVIKELAAKE